MPKCKAQVDQEHYNSLLQKDPIAITEDDLKFVCGLIEGKTYAKGCEYLIKACELAGTHYLTKYGNQAYHDNQKEAKELQDIENQSLQMTSSKIKDSADPRQKYFRIIFILFNTEQTLLHYQRSGRLSTYVNLILHHCWDFYLPPDLRGSHLNSNQPFSSILMSTREKSVAFPDIPKPAELAQLIQTRDTVFSDAYDKLGEGALRKIVPDVMKGFGMMQKLIQETDVTATHLKALRNALTKINNETNIMVMNKAIEEVRKVLITISPNTNRPPAMSKLYLNLCNQFMPKPSEFNNATNFFLNDVQQKLQGLIKILETETKKEDTGMEMVQGGKINVSNDFT